MRCKGRNAAGLRDKTITASFRAPLLEVYYQHRVLLQSA